MISFKRRHWKSIKSFSPGTVIRQSYQPSMLSVMDTLTNLQQQHSANILKSRTFYEKLLQNCFQQQRKQKTRDNIVSRVYHTLVLSVESRRLTVETLSSFISERRISGMKSKKTFQMLSENVKAIFTLKCFREFIPISLQCHIIYLGVIFKDEPNGCNQSSEG